jgi:hypothetical protein
MTKRGMFPLQLVLSYKHLFFLDSDWIPFGQCWNIKELSNRKNTYIVEFSIFWCYQSFVQNNGTLFFSNFFSVMQQPNSVLGRQVLEVSISHTIRNKHKSGRTPFQRVIISSQKPLTAQHTTNTRDQHPFSQYPRSQQSSGFGPTS